MKLMQVVLKLSERCNLGCQYCYMYTGPDQSWRNLPRFLSEENQDFLITRFIEHTKEFPDYSRILEIHGGEPLLFGKAKMAAFLSKVRYSLPPKSLDVCLQTNGVLIDD